MKTDKRKELPADGKVVTIFLHGTSLEKVAKRKQKFFNETKNNLSWANAVIKVLEEK